VQPALDVPDPRVFVSLGDAAPLAARLHRLAAASLEADVGARADALDSEIRAAIRAEIEDGGSALAPLLESAPSIAIARHLWRQLDAACRPVADEGGVALTLFALPVVIVAGSERASAEATLPGVIAEPRRLVEMLERHGALGGNRSFGLSEALVAAESIEFPKVAELFAWQRVADGSATPRAPTPAPLRVSSGGESVHLRFLIGTAVASSGIDPVAASDVGGWGLPLARELGRHLAAPGVTVLALPRAPNRPLPAARLGQIAQREVTAGIFCANALRRIRATAGEPVAVISAHRCAAAPRGGELRLSLASPFAERGAEGFRCPLHALDRVQDVVTMLTELLSDCRVDDIRAVAGVQPDRDPATGQPLLFRHDTIPPAGAVH
jgi:hypothetical protein